AGIAHRHVERHAVCGAAQGPWALTLGLAGLSADVGSIAGLAAVDRTVAAGIAHRGVERQAVHRTEQRAAAEAVRDAGVTVELRGVAHLRAVQEVLISALGVEAAGQALSRWAVVRALVALLEAFDDAVAARGQPARRRALVAVVGVAVVARLAGARVAVAAHVEGALAGAVVALAVVLSEVALLG